MAIAYKILANGQIAATKGAIYTVPASTEAIIKQIKLVNTNTSTETVNVYALPSGGTSRRMIPVGVPLLTQEMLEVLDDEITLGAADAIEADTTTALQVDYTVWGVEKT